MAEAAKQIKALSEDEIKRILSSEIADSISYNETELSEQRRQAIRYYYGQPLGNEVEGRSEVILTDVADTIEWIMPSLMRMFTGGDIVAEYLPREKNDVEIAQEATDFVNVEFMEENAGFLVLYDWFKTALLEKNGFTKVYYEELNEPKLSYYRGLTEDQLAELLNDDKIEIVEQREYAQSIEGVALQLFDVTTRQVEARCKVRVGGIAPEEFLISRRAVRLDDNTSFSAHRRKVRVSDLIAMGVPKDVAIDLPSEEGHEYSMSRLERHHEDEGFPDANDDRADPASREVWLTECYIRIDADGDGYSELRKITVAGEEAGLEIIDNEIINWNPICSITPIPFPHKFFGVSIADQVMDLQKIRSTLLRQMLDNTYLVNDSRLVVEEGSVTIDDLLESRPGGIIRADHTDAVKPLDVRPLGPMAHNMLEYLAGVREERTGITRYNQGLDASSLNHTASGINALLTAANARIELIARIFAETGLKDLFRKMLRLYKEAPVKKRVARLRGEFKDVDPQRWTENMDVRIRVGMGIGQAAERIGNLMQILDLQKTAFEMSGDFIVTPDNFYNSLRELEQAMGYSAENLFFTNPAQREPPQPPPDPKMIEAQQQAQKDQADAALKDRELEIDRFRIEQDVMIRREQMEQERQLEEMRMRLDAELRERDLEIRRAEVESARQQRASGGESDE